MIPAAGRDCISITSPGPSFDDSVPSPTNVSQNEDTGATPETEQISSRIFFCLVNIRSLECLDSNIDMRCYAKCKQNVSDEKKV